MICPFRGWGSYRSTGKSPRALSPINQSAGRTHHIAPSHYSFHQRLVSNPACTEEMMRGGGGHGKTFAGLPGAGCRAQNEIMLTPWTACTARGMGSIPARGHARFKKVVRPW